MYTVTHTSQPLKQWHQLALRTDPCLEACILRLLITCNYIQSIQFQGRLTLSVLSVEPLTTVCPLNSEHHTPPVCPCNVFRHYSRDNIFITSIVVYNVHVCAKNITWCQKYHLVPKKLLLTAVGMKRKCLEWYVCMSVILQESNNQHIPYSGNFFVSTTFHKSQNNTRNKFSRFITRPRGHHPTPLLSHSHNQICILHVYTYIFTGKNFHELASTRENIKIWALRKFPAIQ